jgi:hypothetical protein
MIKLILVTCSTLLFSIPCARAQGADAVNCVVSVFDAGAKNWGMHALPLRELGGFAVVPTEDQMTTRAFRLQGTGLFAVASVSHPSDSQPSDGGAKPFSLSLIISPRAQLNMRQLDLRQVLYAASAEVGPNNLDNVSVSTVVRRRGGSRIVTLACRKGVPR